MECISRSPASVGATFLVVRASRRTPSLSSSVLMVWLSEDGVTPSLAAALVKLCSRATARNACRSFIFVCAITEFCSQLHQDCTGLSRRCLQATMHAIQYDPA